MAHEKSETVKRGSRWFNIDTVGKDKGRVLGNQKGFATSQEAVSAAKKRSQSFNVPKRKPTKK